MAAEYEELFSRLGAAHARTQVLKIQAWWRAMRRQKKLGRWRQRRARRMQLHFRAWFAVTNADMFFGKMLCKWVWRGWNQVVDDSKRIRDVSWKVFQRRIGNKKLSITAVNLFFQDDVDFPDTASQVRRVSHARPSSRPCLPAPACAQNLLLFAPFSPPSPPPHTHTSPAARASAHANRGRTSHCPPASLG